MKLAFCLFNYFPYGGLQRDFLRIAKVCRDRGHTILVYTMQWEGELEPGLQIHLIASRGMTNHARILSYISQLKTLFAQEHHDLVVGFNKMPGLDVYYAADVCYQARVRAQRNFFYRLLPRYRHYIQFEKAVFAHGLPTRILLISATEQQKFMHYYGTEASRFYLLPPGIRRECLASGHTEMRRNRVRENVHLMPGDYLLLMVGSGFKTKGVDRAIEALASLPADLKARCHLLIIGKDRPTTFLKLAHKRQIAERVHFLGAREDVPDFLLAADLLLHPAYHENTGTVLLEALAAGLPVLTVEACGYAHYVSEAKAGIVISAPFTQCALNECLKNMLLSPEMPVWRERAIAFATKANIYSMPEVAADLIEAWL